MYHGNDCTEALCALSATAEHSAVVMLYMPAALAAVCIILPPWRTFLYMYSILSEDDDDRPRAVLTVGDLTERRHLQRPAQHVLDDRRHLGIALVLSSLHGSNTAQHRA